MARKYAQNLKGEYIMLKHDPSPSGQPGRIVLVTEDTSQDFVDYYSLAYKCFTCSCIDTGCSQMLYDHDFDLVGSQTIGTVQLDQQALANAISDGLSMNPQPAPIVNIDEHQLANAISTGINKNSSIASVDTFSLTQGVKEGMEDSVSEIVSKVMTHMNELERKRNEPPPKPKANIKLVTEEDEDFYL